MVYWEHVVGKREKLRIAWSEVEVRVVAVSSMQKLVLLMILRVAMVVVTQVATQVATLVETVLDQVLENSRPFLDHPSTKQEDHFPLQF